jgi:hypothetical protein
MAAPTHLTADVAAIFVLAAAYGACFGCLARIAGHRARVWLPLAFIGGLVAGILAEIVVAVAFAVVAFAAIPTRPLTLEEDAAVEPMPGPVGTSWYVRGRAYWGMRIVAAALFGYGVILGTATWVWIAQAIAGLPERGCMYTCYLPVYDPWSTFRVLAVVVVGVTSNVISALWMWRSLSATDRKLLALPAHAPLPWPSFRAHYSLRLLSFLVLPFFTGAAAVLLLQYCRREIPSERLMRARAERLLQEYRS